MTSGLSNNEKFLVFSGGFFFLSLYINQAPHNIFTALFVISGLIFITSNKNESLQLIRTEKVFLGALTAYAGAYLAINLYHFSFPSKDLSYALSRLRWAPYALILIPTSLLWTKKKLKASKPSVTVFLLIFSLLSTFIFYDSITRVLFDSPSTSLWFKSSQTTSLETERLGH